jgi:AcrR family transcriptional regulator
MQTRSHDTYNRILSSSYELFSRHGYEATGVSLICEKAQISKGAFYHHFPSKKDVLLSLIENWLTDINNQFFPVSETLTGIPEQFLAMSPALFPIFSKAESIPLFLELWLQAMRDPEIAHRLIKPYYKYCRYFENMFEEGITEGSFDAETDPHYSMRMVMALAIGLIMQSMIEPKRGDWQKITQYSIEKITSGLRKEQS